MKNIIKFILPDKKIDAISAEPKDCSVNTSFPPWKTVKLGSVTYEFTDNPAVGNRVLSTINHGLKYVPAVMVYAAVGTKMGPFISYGEANCLPWANLVIQLEGGAFSVMHSINTSVDSTKFDIVYNRTDTGASPADGGQIMSGMILVFNYYIFADAGA